MRSVVYVMLVCGCAAFGGCGARSEDAAMKDGEVAPAASPEARAESPVSAAADASAEARARVGAAPPHLDGGGSDDAVGDGATDADAGVIQTVFLIIMENKNWSEVAASASASYLNEQLVPQASIALNYRGPQHGKLHPSEPNYLWLEGGDDFGVVDDDDPDRNHQATEAHLVTMLEHAGVEWRSYQEDISGEVCPLTKLDNYRPKHNPMVYFDDVTDRNDPQSARCIEHIRPLTELTDALAGSGTLGRYNLIIPNVCNDMHEDCSPSYDRIEQGDKWLATWIPKIQASGAYQHGGVIFITWDEAEESRECPGGDCPIGFLALSTLAKGGGFASSLPYDHSSTLKSLQQIFGVAPLLRAAAGADVNDLADLFTTYP